MSLKQKLQNEFLLRGKMTRDECREIGRLNNYDSATVDRELRHLTENKVIEPITTTKRYNGIYRLITPEKGSFEPLNGVLDSTNNLIRILEESKRKKEVIKGMF